MVQPLVVAVLGVACATFRPEPWVLESASLSAGPVRRAAWIVSYPQALATALDILEGELGLPRVDVRVVFLPDRPAFEALLREIGYPPDLAADAAADMRAIGGYRNILVNESRLTPLEWGDRTALFAHELVHVLQYELGGGVRGASDQWLREGLAEWVELEVLESLQVIESSAHARRLALDQLRSLAPEEVTRLTALRTFPEWVAAGRGGAARRLYDLGLTAVDGLIDRHGMDAVLRYFGRFAAAQDAEGNFLASFGQSVAEFDQDLRCRLSRC